MTCPTCLRPQATEDDARTWAVSSDGNDTPEGWPDPDGSHLCWKEIADGECEPPEWFAAVTPAKVLSLHTQIATLTPTWRDGTPPADVQVWREYLGAKGPVVVYTFANHNDGRIMYYGFADDEPREWGTVRWAPTIQPREAP